MNDIDIKKMLGVVLAAIVGGSGASIGTSYITESDKLKSDVTMRHEFAQMIIANRSHFNHQIERLENKVDSVSEKVGEVNGKLSILIKGM